MGRGKRHSESHRLHRVGWLRAAVLGANDGIVSTASLVVGVAAAGVARGDVLLSAAAGLVAGAMSMAAGEYVSVSSQADIESADLARERRELLADPEHEKEELAQIYVERGLDPVLARQVSEQFMKHDALKSHARDELGITEISVARPIQAAAASALTFSVGAALPLLVVLIAPAENLLAAVPVAALVFLTLLGVVSARAGGANPLKAAARVGFWGAFAMAATALIGSLFGTTVA